MWADTCTKTLPWYYFPPSMYAWDIDHVQILERSWQRLDLPAWTEIWGNGWTFQADLFGKQSIKGVHYSVLQRGHSLSLSNGFLIYMHLLRPGTKSIVWQVCSLLPGINNSLKNMVSIDLLFKHLLLPSAGVQTMELKKQQILLLLGISVCGKI